MLEAAAALFREHGVDGVSMDAIAAAAGVGKGTLFRRFGDKAGLAVALLDEQERALQEAVLFGPAPLGPNGSAAPAERLRSFVDAYLDYLYTFAVVPGAITAQDRHVWDGDYACPANREAGYNYYRAFTQNATFDTTTNTSKLTVEVAGVGGENSFGNFTATSFENVDSNVHTIIAPGSGHYVPEEVPTFLSTCATLFFSPNPPATAPVGFESCLP